MHHHAMKKFRSRPLSSSESSVKIGKNDILWCSNDGRVGHVALFALKCIFRRLLQLNNFQTLWETRKSSDSEVPMYDICIYCMLTAYRNCRENSYYYVSRVTDDAAHRDNRWKKNVSFLFFSSFIRRVSSWPLSWLFCRCLIQCNYCNLLLLLLLWMAVCIYACDFLIYARAGEWATERCTGPWTSFSSSHNAILYFSPRFQLHYTCIIIIITIYEHVRPGDMIIIILLWYYRVRTGLL